MGVYRHKLRTGTMISRTRLTPPLVDVIMLTEPPIIHFNTTIIPMPTSFERAIHIIHRRVRTFALSLKTGTTTLTTL